MKARNVCPLFIFLSALVLISCEKEPKASFYTDKESYVAGDKIYLINTSTDADHYEWLMPLGQIERTPNTDYPTYMSFSGELTFVLNAYSKSGDKGDAVSKTVTVSPGICNLTFWSRSVPTSLITVEIDSLTAYITSACGSTPDCGAYGCANFYNLPYTTGVWFVATDGVRYWDDLINAIQPCLTYELVYDKAHMKQGPYRNSCSSEKR